MTKTLIKDAIKKVQLDVAIVWLAADIQESIEHEDYIEIAKLSSELTKKTKAFIKLKEKYTDCAVAEELYTALRSRNNHKIDEVDVKYVEDVYYYILDKL